MYITLNIKKLPEGLFLATSQELEGLVAQGKTVEETIEIAQDVAKNIIKLKRELTIPKLTHEIIGKPVLVKI